MARRLSLKSDRGFTIIELMVAMTILAVGILGTATMIDTSNANTSKTKAREGATNLGRAVMEVARAVPYKDLDVNAVQAELATHPGLQDANPSKAGYQIASRNFNYDLTIDVCAIDDPKDHLGDSRVEAKRHGAGGAGSGVSASLAARYDGRSFDSSVSVLP